MFRKGEGTLEVLLVHPGGPFFRNKESGAWTIPKGEVADGEELRDRARLEFGEELGIEPPASDWIELGTVKQKGGKTVHAWAFEGDLPQDFVLNSNSLRWNGRRAQGGLRNSPRSIEHSFFPSRSRRKRSTWRR
jgi:predicted NUDIX family NTP pyrophosphohydrolase